MMKFDDKIVKLNTITKGADFAQDFAFLKLDIHFKILITIIVISIFFV